MATWADVDELAGRLPGAERAVAHDGSPAWRAGRHTFARLRCGDDGDELVQVWTGEMDTEEALAGRRDVFVHIDTFRFRVTLWRTSTGSTGASWRSCSSSPTTFGAAAADAVTSASTISSVERRKARLRDEVWPLDCAEAATRGLSTVEGARQASPTVRASASTREVTASAPWSGGLVERADDARVP